MATIHHGAWGGTFMPRRRPVTTAEPSRTVTGFFNKNRTTASAMTAETTAVKISRAAPRPNRYTEKAAAGASAITTDHMIFGMDSPDLIWGGLRYQQHLFFIFGYGHITASIIALP